MVKKLSLILGIALISFVSVFSYYKLDDILLALILPQAVSINSGTITLTPIDSQKGLYILKMQQVSPQMGYHLGRLRPSWKYIQLEEGFRKGWYINTNAKSKFVTEAGMSCVLLSNSKAWLRYGAQLTTPIYDPKAHTLTYEAILTSISWSYNSPPPLPKTELKLGKTSLFILLHYP